MLNKAAENRFFHTCIYSKANFPLFNSYKVLY